MEDKKLGAKIKTERIMPQSSLFSSENPGNQTRKI